jgi:hypothetical protein
MACRFATAIGTLMMLLAQFFRPAIYSLEFVYWEVADLLGGGFSS